MSSSDPSTKVSLNPPQWVHSSTYTVQYSAGPDPIETISPVPGANPRSTHWSIAPCVNVRNIDVAVKPSGPGVLAQEIVTSAPVAKLHSIRLTFDVEVRADLGSQVDFRAWEAFESHLCYVADMKLKKELPEKFLVTLGFTPQAVWQLKMDGGEVRLGKFLDGLQKRGALEVDPRGNVYFPHVALIVRGALAASPS